jgi:hypothetical protein
MVNNVELGTKLQFKNNNSNHSFFKENNFAAKKWGKSSKIDILLPTHDFESHYVNNCIQWLYFSNKHTNNAQ